MAGDTQCRGQTVVRDGCWTGLWVEEPAEGLAHAQGRAQPGSQWGVTHLLSKKHSKMPQKTCARLQLSGETLTPERSGGGEAPCAEDSRLLLWGLHLASSRASQILHPPPCLCAPMEPHYLWDGAPLGAF